MSVIVSPKLVFQTINQVASGCASWIVMRPIENVSQVNNQEGDPSPNCHLPATICVNCLVTSLDTKH